MSKQPSFVPSVEATLLQKRLSATSIGDVVTYEEMSQIIGREVRHTHSRHFLVTAVRNLRNADGVVFDTIRTVGIKRLNDVEVVSKQQKTRLHIKRSAEKGMKELSTVKYDALPGPAKIEHNTAMAMLGVQALFSRTKSYERLSAEIANTQQVLPVAKTLELFVKGG